MPAWLVRVRPEILDPQLNELWQVAADAAEELIMPGRAAKLALQLRKLLRA
jgi:hypothetical protein